MKQAGRTGTFRAKSEGTAQNFDPSEHQETYHMLLLQPPRLGTKDLLLLLGEIEESLGLLHSTVDV